MQQKLDAASKKKRVGIWWWFPVAVIAIGAGIYIYSNETRNASVVISSVSKNTIVEKLDTNNVQSKTHQNIIEEDNVASIKPNVKDANISIEKNETAINSSKVSINKKANTSKLKESILVKKGSINANNSKHPYFNSDNSMSSKTAVADNLINSDNKKEVANKTDAIDNTLKAIAGASNTNVYTPNILYMHNRYIANYKELEAENIAVVAKRKEDARKMVEEESRPRVYPTQLMNIPTNRWFLTAYLGNNIAYVSNPKISDSHLQFQLGFGYNITKNISLQTGIAVGNKTFSMRKDQFTYKGPGAYEKYIRNIDAEVSVIDIPINLRYQFSDRENFGWFTTIGISTIFSKKENYAIAIDNWSTPNYLYQNFENTPSWLSMLNLSVGYQYPLSKKVTLTVEPYLQLPFKVIGEGGSKLCSVGLQIGAKYNLPKKKR
jgi:hypothetical protein